MATRRSSLTSQERAARRNPNRGSARLSPTQAPGKETEDPEPTPKPAEAPPKRSDEDKKRNLLNAALSGAPRGLKSKIARYSRGHSFKHMQAFLDLVLGGKMSIAKAAKVTQARFGK